jgi:bacteriorhodopsin
MGSLRQGITLTLICLVVLAFSVAGIAASFALRIELNIDGILLIAIGLMMAGIFGLMLLLLAREQGWIPARSKKEEAPGTAKKAVPASSAPAETKSAPQQASGS